jgi:hypothetical protein
MHVYPALIAALQRKHQSLSAAVMHRKDATQGKYLLY